MTTSYIVDHNDHDHITGIIKSAAKRHFRPLKQALSSKRIPRNERKRLMSLSTDGYVSGAIWVFSQFIMFLSKEPHSLLFQGYSEVLLDSENVTHIEDASVGYWLTKRDLFPIAATVSRVERDSRRSQTIDSFRDGGRWMQHQLYLYVNALEAQVS